MFDTLKILRHQGKQFIPDITAAKLPAIFRGRAVISTQTCPEGCATCVELCPTEAIYTTEKNKITLDLGKCVFCNECVKGCSIGKITFSNDHKTATNERSRLIVQEGEDKAIMLNPDLVRREIIALFGRSLKLRQVSAGGENATEMELNAGDNVNFDMSRFGIDFVASPRHADGIVISGPISANMAEALQICYDAVPEPKIIILAGTEAISGGIFADSPALNRQFLDKHKIDLYVPGNPPHPLTFINGILDMLRGGLHTRI